MYNVEFLSFKIRDMDTNKTFFELQAPGDNQDSLPPDFNIDDLPDDVRTVRYQFTPDFLDLKTIGTRLGLLQLSLITQSYVLCW